MEQPLLGLSSTLVSCIYIYIFLPFIDLYDSQVNSIGQSLANFPDSLSRLRAIMASNSARLLVPLLSLSKSELNSSVISVLA